MTHQSSRRARLITAGILSSALLAGCPWDSPEKHLARGKEMAAKNDHAQAVIEFKNFLQSNPKSIEGRFLLGRELLAQGDFKAAGIELQKAYDGRYSRDAVLPLLVKSQLLQGEFDKISAEVKGGALELGSPQASALLQSLFGTSLLLRGKADEALVAYRKSQQYVAGYPDGMVGEAKIKAARGDLDGASAEIAQVLAGDPGHDGALVVKGDIAIKRGDTKGAAEAYLAAVARSPKNIVARMNLAGTYLDSQSYDLAQKQVAELKRLAPGYPGVNYLDALIAFHQKDYSRAGEAIALSLNEYPGNGNAQILSGAIALQNKQPEQAELHLLEGIRLEPRSLYARNLLVRLYLGRRQPQKAEDVLRPALAAFPENPGFLAMAGEIALQQGNFAEASTMFDKASQLQPDNAQVRTQAAISDIAKGDDARGLKTLEAAAGATNNNPLPQTALVLARLQRGQYDQAAEAWKALQAEQPKDPVTYNLRAAIDLGLKNIGAARKDLEHALELDPTFFTVVANLAALDEQAGDLGAARSRYKTLLAKDKNNVSGLIALAQFEARHGAKPDVVVPLLNEARRINPAATQPVVVLASYYASQNQIAQAISVTQEGLTKSPNSLNLATLMAQLQFRNGNIDVSIAALRQLVAARPKNIDFQVALGQALLASNQVEPAMRAFADAIQADPNAYAAQTTAISSLLASDKVEPANKLLATIRKSSPHSPVLAELEADTKMAAKHYADAASDYRKLNAQSPSADTVIKLATALQLVGDAQNANAVVAEWLKTHPDDVVVRTFDANNALRANRYAQAAEGYRTVLRSRPNDSGVLNNLAWALWQQKDPEALAVARKASEIAPDSPMVNDTLGWILVEQGDVKQGLDVLQRAVTAAPKQTDIALHLAKAQIKDGRTDAARTTLQNLVRSAPDSAEGKESKSLIASMNSPPR
jgi:putative PEP-CTERM system TPR-repeat lipoprotein